LVFHAANRWWWRQGRTKWDFLQIIQGPIGDYF
jgi:hypothetical protein